MRRKLYSKTQTIKGLRYIALSPDREHGGFHFETVMIAKSALHYISEQKRQREQVILGLVDIMEKSCDLCAKKEAERLLSIVGHWKTV